MHRKLSFFFSPEQSDELAYTMTDRFGDFQEAIRCGCCDDCGFSASGKLKKKLLKPYKSIVD